MTKKITLFSLVLIVALLLVPTICNAAIAEPVTTEAELVAAIQNAADVDSLTLGADITLNAPITVTKKLDINGAGHIIAASDEWKQRGGSGNQSLLTAAGEGSRITLINTTLTNSPKYGIQAFNGGFVLLNDVTIQNCKFGGVLVNGGKLNIAKLTLGRNGESANNGIEIDKAQASYTDPVLTMNGTLNSSEEENVIYLATNSNLTKFTVENTESAVNKILVTSEGNVVVTNENNQVIYTAGGKELESDNISGEEYVPNIKVTFVFDIDGEKIEVDPIEVMPGEKVTAEELKEAIELGFAESEANLEVVGFYADEKYEKEFDFSKAFDSDTTIYTKVKTIENAETEGPKTELPAKEEKDDTPKTGTINYIVVAAIVLVVSSLGVVALKNKRA